MVSKYRTNGPWKVNGLEGYVGDHRKGHYIVIDFKYGNHFHRDQTYWKNKGGEH